MRNVLKPLAKSILIPLGSRAATLATDEPIHEKNVWIEYNTINNFNLRNRNE